MFKVINIDKINNNFIISYNDNADPIEIKIPRGIDPHADDFNIESIEGYINSLLPLTSNNILSDTVYSIVAESDILQPSMAFKEALENNKIRLSNSPHVNKDITVTVNNLHVNDNVDFILDKARSCNISVAESYKSIDEINTSNSNTFLILSTNINRKYLFSKEEINELLKTENAKVLKDYSSYNGNDKQWTEVLLNTVVDSNGNVIFVNWLESTFKEELISIRYLRELVDDSWPGSNDMLSNDFFVNRVINSEGSSRLDDNVLICNFFNSKCEQFIKSLGLSSAPLSLKFIKYEDEYYFIEVNPLSFYYLDNKFINKNLLVQALFDRSKNIHSVLNYNFNIKQANIINNNTLKIFVHNDQCDVLSYMSNNCIITKMSEMHTYTCMAESYAECSKKINDFEIFLEEI